MQDQGKFDGNLEGVTPLYSMWTHANTWCFLEVIILEKVKIVDPIIMKLIIIHYFLGPYG